VLKVKIGGTVFGQFPSKSRKKAVKKNPARKPARNPCQKRKTMAGPRGRVAVASGRGRGPGDLEFRVRLLY